MARNSTRKVALSSTALTALGAFSGLVPVVGRDGKAENLDAPGVDCAAMMGYWDQVDTILRGAEAMRAAGEKYLPRFPDETNDDFDWRLKMTKFTNVFRDIVEGLAAKPFETAVRVDMSTDDEEGEAKGEPDDLPEQISEFIENVDGAYNSITEFAASVFFQGLADAVTWIFVDYPNAPVDPIKPRTIEEEKKLGIRPFWTHVLGRNVREARSAFVGGNEVLTYVRLMEPVGDDNFVRIMYRDETGARWELWKQVNRSVRSVGSATKWVKVEEGVFSIGLIPMVPFAVGRRRGRSQFYFPAMRDAADLQLELYWQESGLKHIKTMAAFPMLAGNGVKPPKAEDGKKVQPIRVAPMAAIYAPPDGQGSSGSWTLLEPSSTSLTFLQSDVEKTILQLRELGRNPLTANSGNLTVVTTMVAAKKGNSAVQMWALAEENVIDIALYYTALWYGIDEATADRIRSHLFTDFDIDAEGGEAFTSLLKMRETGDLSQRSLWKEMVRRDLLSADFDPDAEEQALLDEGPTDDGTMIDPETGRAIPGQPVKKPASPVIPA